MKSGLVGQSPATGDATSAPSWTKRVLLGTLGTAGASVAIAAFAATAFANAPNPVSATATASDPDANGHVTVTVAGSWSWEAPISPTPQTNCNGRYGAGWAVDWWGVGGSGAAINGLSYPAVAKSGANIASPPSLTTSTVAAPATVLTTKTGTTFHASETLTGFTTPLCTNGHPVGNFSSTATYPSAQSVPAKICVNFYDLHGSPGNPKLNDFFSNASDNSIKTNAFDPATVGGNCFVVVPEHPSIEVDKTNNAGGGAFADSNTASSLDEDVTFKVAVKNTSTVSVVVDTVTDAIPSTAAHNGVTCNTSNGANLVGQTIAPGATATCTFSKAKYLTNNLPNNATELVNDVVVTVHSPQGKTGQDNDTSKVNAPAKATLSAHIRRCDNGNLIGGGNLHERLGGTIFGDVADLGPISVNPGTYELGANAPNGFEFVNCPAHQFNGNDVQSITLAAGDAGVLNFYVAPVAAPHLTVSKTGPATGDLNGNGTYTITALNDGTGASAATTFTDTLPNGESFVTAGSSPACTAAGQTVTCTLGPLAAGAHQDFTVVVKYTKTGQLTDCATIAGQPVPSCVTTDVGEPDLEVVKDGPANGDLNGNGTYTMTVTNTGNRPSLATTFTDTLPNGETFVVAGSSSTCSAQGQVVTCTVPALAVGANAKYTVVVKYTKTGQLTDCATIAGQPVPSCVTTDVGEPELLVVKDGPATGLLNGNGTYTMTVTNQGNRGSTATTFTDTLPNGETFVAAGSSAECTAQGQVVTCTVPALAVGAHATYTVVVKYTKTGQLTDCATIAGQANPSCVTTDVGEPELRVVKDGPATGTLNGNGTYTMTVTNQGNRGSTATTFTDTLPNGETFVAAGSSPECSAVGQVVTCTVPALAAGAHATYTVVVTYTKPGSLTDCATIAGQPNPSCVTTRIPGEPALTVTKTNDADGDGIFHDSETAAHKGDPVTFRVVVTNNSSVAVAIDSVVDVYGVLSLEECPNLIGAVLTPGQSVTCTFTIDNYAPAAGSSLLDTVTVKGHEDGVPGNTTEGSDTSTVKTRNPPKPGEPDLAIVKSADVDTVEVGDTLTYNLAVTNVGEGPTTGTITVTDSIPAGLDLVGVSGTDWDCSVSGSDITCVYLGGDLAAGESAPDITVVTTVNNTAGLRVINTGVVDTPGDHNPDNDRSTVETPVTRVLPERIPNTNPPTEVLPFTGSNATSMIPVGLLMVMVGGLLLVATRRRAQQH